ncbi:zeta toxin family protein [Candidatus Saccharibacteria bacterium]|nr:zeta toxin family protein [Candidatus Saccharibacteria bacterium]
MSESHYEELEKVVAYMKSHWPSDVRQEWQVSLVEYPEILKKVIQDFTKGRTKNKKFIRIAGLSGSGKTSQILPAVEAYCEKNKISPILIAARKFVAYHPHCEEIKAEYGEENLRKKTDEFSTIMMFLTLNALTKEGYDIVLDVTLLDPLVEQILIKMLKEGSYTPLLLMIATSPTVTEHFLGSRSWRHSKETEAEFIRATSKALEFYAEKTPDLHIILWSVYDLDPIYDGEVKNSLEIFNDYSSRTNLPKNDDDARRNAKIEYMMNMNG